MKSNLDEIKRFQLKQLPALPSDLDDYFNSLLLTTQPMSSDLFRMYKHVKSDDFHPKEESKLEWAQFTVLETIKLYMSGYFPLSDHSESDILRRIWMPLEKVFDCSVITARRYFFCFFFVLFVL